MNTKDFSKRLEKVISFYGESASSFAEKIGVQRSSISHVLSGRNKPSLEFVLKIISRFNEVDLYWLLNGDGNFPKVIKKETTPKDLFSSPTSVSKSSIVENGINEKKEIKNSNTKDIVRIVIFYSDGSFENFEN